MKLLEWARRFLLVCSLGLWLGAFALYTSAVISIGHRHFPGRQFGFVTGEVTVVLQGVSAAAILLSAANLAIDWRRLPGAYRWAFGTVGIAMAVLLLGCVVVHAKLDTLLNYDTRQIRDQTLFDPLHERYELVASLQWGCGLLYLGILVASWRRLDQGVPGA